VLKPGAVLDERALISAVKQQIDPYKAPKAVLMVDALPKTSTGKIQKNEIREKFSGHYAGDAG
jgi:acyl-coenzyme A synthetase/AMP-(fatty) acid ligase